MGEKRLNRKVIRVGDWVKIVVPRFVERVGYPRSLKDYKGAVEVLYKEQLDAIFEKRDRRGILRAPPFVEWRARERVVHEIAYMLARQDGFGGRDRTMHFKEVPEMDGKMVQVQRVRTCMTGTYYAPSCDGEDYEPGGLDGQKRHRLLLVKSGWSGGLNLGFFDPDDYWVPVEHVNAEGYDHG